MDNVCAKAPKRVISFRKTQGWKTFDGGTQLSSRVLASRAERPGADPQHTHTRACRHVHMHVHSCMGTYISTCVHTHMCSNGHEAAVVTAWTQPSTSWCTLGEALRVLHGPHIAARCLDSGLPVLVRSALVPAALEFPVYTMSGQSRFSPAAPL